MTFSSYFEYPGVAAREEAAEKPFLAHLEDAAMDRLLGYCEMRRLVAGERLLGPEDGERAVYVVADGRLEIESADTDGATTVALAPGAVIGAVSFLDARPPAARVRAVTDCEIFRLSFAAFEVLAARDPLLARELLLDLGRIVAGRLRAAGLSEP